MITEYSGGRATSGRPVWTATPWSRSWSFLRGMALIIRGVRIGHVDGGWRPADNGGPGFPTRRPDDELPRGTLLAAGRHRGHPGGGRRAPAVRGGAGRRPAGDQPARRPP